MNQNYCGDVFVSNERNGKVLASNASIALRRHERMRGLAGRYSIGDSEGLIFPRCRQVHTFGMRFPIDVIFANRDGIVLKLNKKLAPRRITSIVFGGYYVVELPAGRIDETETVKGDRLIFQRK